MRWPSLIADDGRPSGSRQPIGIVVREMAGDAVSERRRFAFASVDRARTPRMKRASRRRMKRVGDGSRDRAQAVMTMAVGPGNRFEQAARVRIERISKQLRTRRLLHHARRVENRHVVGILGDDS